MCFNMLFLLLMWIKAPAKQLAQSSALTSLIGIGEFPFFSSRWEGWGGVLGKNQSSNPCPLTALVAQEEWLRQPKGRVHLTARVAKFPKHFQKYFFLFQLEGNKLSEGILLPGIVLLAFLIKRGIWGTFLKFCNPSQHSLSVLALLSIFLSEH